MPITKEQSSINHSRNGKGQDLVLVSAVPVVLRSSCVISSWLQYF